MVGKIDISRLNLPELTGVVNLYPWYAGARMELCRRMIPAGDALSRQQLDNTALYLPKRELVRELLPRQEHTDCSDKDIQELLRAYFESREGEEQDDDGSGREEDRRQIIVVGGDYFTQAQYEKARRSTDNIFSSFASKARSEVSFEAEEGEFDLYTETLAQIYAEQGYPAEARRIYEKLAALEPAKAVYYATLAEKV